MTEKNENVTRRGWIKTAGGLVAGLAIGGAAGYLAKPAEVVQTTQTVEKTVTETVTAAGTQAAAYPKLKIAAINAEPRDDLGWGQQGWDALLQAQKLYGADIHMTEGVVAPSDVIRVVEDYIQKGYSVILGNGSHTGEPLHTQGVPLKYPDTTFMWTCVQYSDPNAYSFVYREEETGFMQGAAAALVTKSGKVGVVLPAPAPCTYSFQNGFILGAKAAKPNVSVSKALVGSWVDPVKAKDMTMSMIQDGVDAIGHYGCGCQLGIYEAVEKNNVKVFGTFYDQSSLAPNTLVFSVHFNHWQGLNAVLQDVFAKKVDGKLLPANYAAGTYWNIPNPQVWNTMSDDFKTKIAYLESRLKGRTNTPGKPGLYLIVPRIEYPAEEKDLPSPPKDIFG